MGCASSASHVQPYSDVGGPHHLANFHSEFLLLKKLGKGASASVYAARREGEGVDGEPQLAVKILDLRRKKSGDPDAPAVVDKVGREETIKEIRLLRLVGRNEHCALLVAASVEEPFAYLVLERATCTLLHHLERNVQLTEASCAEVFLQMLQGLIHIHALGVVHRDVKPDNYLCFERATVRLCDFGLAEVCAKDPEKAQLDGIFGTAPFMAPEMLTRTRYGPKVDVWSLAVVAYALLFGHFPYHPIERNSRSMKAAILAGVPAPKFTPRTISGRTPMVSDGARAFVQELLARDPRRRPGTPGSCRRRR